ncbi:MAG TPA: hypothetical protein VJC07_02975 [Candidatus Nanoarchaeia archaeon]|nr:hypothetical protein [Candidatus Nanoarchaeia archaeon]
MPAFKYISEGYQVKQKSVFDLDDLYLTLHNWFLFYGYNRNEVEYKVMETESYLRVEMRWENERKAGDDPYVKLHINMGLVITGLDKTEVVKDGVKIKMDKGTVEFRLTAFMEKDPEGKWSSSPFMRKIRELYDKYIIRDRLESYKKLLATDERALINEIRSFLHLYKYE